MRYWVLITSSLITLTLACVVGTSITTRAELQLPAGQQTSDKVVITKNEVPFDVVVRDKKGRPVKDLAASDFEVYEDGVKQEISSFRFVSSSSVGNNATANDKPIKGGDRSVATNTTDRSEPAVSVLALVFDRLTPEARVRARDAALSYLGESVKKEELVGVFLIDLSVIVLQPLTDDTQLVKAGIEKFSLHAPSLYTSNNEKARETRKAVAQREINVQMGRVRPLPNTEANSAAALELRLLETIEAVERDLQGNATTHSLLNLAASLRSLPGRKAVIFFSEGLILPPDVYEAFRSVVNTANRGNVSFYCIDVAGLRTESKTAETNREINSRSELRMAQVGSTTDPTGPMTKGLERNEDLLRLNPDSGLSQLANETGGFLITDSNDLKNRIQQVDEDLHSYYLLSYSSNNQKYDGHFRKIEVKLKRSGLSVQSRKGYYAIKDSYASPVLSYEARALAVLDSTPKADSFSFYSKGFTFPQKERLGLTPIIVDVPLSAFTLRTDTTKNVYETDFSIVALLKDQAGAVLQKFSKRYTLSGPIEKIEDAKKGRVLFYREADLPPGRYTLETIAYDAPSGHASVLSTTIEVTASDEGKWGMSDVLILQRAEPVNAADQNIANPFRVGNVIVNPNLGEPISRSLKQLPFFFTVYTPAGSTTKPRLTIELRRDGKVLAQIPGELPDADELGRRQFVAALPLEKIPSGSYELRIMVSDETMSISRSGSFTIVD